MSKIVNLAKALALGRLAFGAALIVKPEQTASGWIGADASRPAVQIALRGLGARDVALSAGALWAAGDRESLRRWLAAAACCDLADLAATLAAPSDALPGNARWGTAVLAGGSAVAGIALYKALER
jgi:hypothetical protein